MSTLLFHMKAFCMRVCPEMTEADWQAMEKRLSFRIIRKGDFLNKAGDICRNVSFIHKGIVRFYYVVDGREITTGFIAENQFAADYSSFLQQCPSTKYIEAFEETECADLSFTAINELYKHYPVYQIFGRRMAEQLFISFDQDNTKLTTLSPEERYLELLEKQSPLLQRIPQYMLASYLGVTPEHLSRIRKKVLRS